MSERSLAVGARAPEFALQTADGTTVTLSAFRGQHVVLYYYPKDDTPGCTKEACSFQAHRAALRAAQAVVLGVSRDSVASHERFAGKYQLTFPLLSDPDASVCKAYGVFKQKSLYGRTYWGIERTTFLIDQDGRVTRIFPKVSVDGHTEEILKALKTTSSASASAPRRTASASARTRSR